MKGARKTSIYKWVKKHFSKKTEKSQGGHQLQEQLHERLQENIRQCGEEHWWTVNKILIWGNYVPKLARSGGICQCIWKDMIIKVITDDELWVCQHNSEIKTKRWSIKTAVLHAYKILLIKIKSQNNILLFLIFDIWIVNCEFIPTGWVTYGSITIII